MEQKYITRYLCPNDENFDLDGEFFIPDLHKKLCFYNKMPTSLLELFEVQNCVILTGEKQSGKTLYLKQSYNALNTNNKLWINLDEIGTLSSLNKFLSEKFKQLDFEAGVAYIFLDNLDQILNISPKIYYDILYTLKTYNLQNIKLVLTCNIFNIPSGLENKLKKYLNIKIDTKLIYKLAPFSYNDVKNYVNNDNIFKKLLYNKLNFFAAQPQTINVLFNILFDKQQYSQYQIYECLIKIMLLKSSNTYSSHRFLSIEQKMYIMGYLAYFLIKRNVNELDFDIETNKNKSLCIHDINTGLQRFKSEAINLSEVDFENLLQCGLFYLNDNKTYTFKSSDVKNFLAAYFLINNSEFRKNPIDMLGVEDHIASIFAEVVSWISAIDGKLFNQVLEQNSHLFLKSSIIFNFEQNKILIDNAVKLLEQGKMTHYDIAEYKLNHPCLAKQIADVLSNSNVNTEVQLFCIILIKNLRLKEFQKWLYGLIADRNNDIDVRSDAILCLNEIGSLYWKNKILSLCDSFVEELSNNDFDGRDHFRGSLLFFLSYMNMPTHKILALLTKEKRSNYGGRYASFLNSIASCFINKSNIHAFLKWISVNIEKDIKDYHRRYLFESILDSAFEYISDKKILNLLSKIIYKHLKDNYYDLNLDIQNIKVKSSGLKKVFISIIYNEIDFKDAEIYLLRNLYFSFFTRDDFLWLCSVYKTEKNKGKQNKLKKFINILIECFPAKLTEKTINYLSIYDEFNKDSELIQIFGKFNTRVYKHKMLAWEKKQFKREQEKVHFNPIEFIEENFTKVGNNINFAYYLIGYLTLKEGKNYNDFSLSPDNYASWVKASDDLKNRILKVFCRFLKKTKVPILTEEYMNASKFQPVWFTLVFINEMLDRSIITLEEAQEIAIKWSDYILLLPRFDSDDEILQKFVQFYYKIAPEAIRKSIRKIIVKSPDKKHPSILNGFENVADDNLNDLLLMLLKPKNKLSVEYKIHILSYLKTIQYNNIEQQALTLLKRAKNDTESVVGLTAFILSLKTDIAWNFIFKYLKNKDHKIIRRIIAKYVSHYDYEESYINNLSQQTVANYYILLYKVFSFEEEEKYNKEIRGILHSTGEVDFLIRFRQELLRKIKHSGLFDALKIIKAKIPRLQNEFWFKHFEFDVYNNSNALIFMNQNFISDNSLDDEEIIIYVESNNDMCFYETIYKKIILNRNNYDFPITPKLKFCSFGSDGGCNMVKNRVNSAIKKQNIYGIVDNDGGKNTSGGKIFVTNRYSMENYLMDPVLLLSILTTNPHLSLYKTIDAKLKKEYNASLINININQLEDISLLSVCCSLLVEAICKEENKIKSCMPEIDIEKSSYYKEFVMTHYTNGLSVKIPRWASENNGHRVIDVLKRFNSSWNEAFLIARLSDINIFCMDIVNLFKQIILDYNYRQ